MEAVINFIRLSDIKPGWGALPGEKWYISTLRKAQAQVPV